MPISFSQIPANIKVPLYWVEVDPSQAGLPSINLRALVFGTMLAAPKVVGTAVEVAAVAQACCTGRSDQPRERRGAGGINNWRGWCDYSRGD